MGFIIFPFLVLSLSVSLSLSPFLIGQWQDLRQRVNSKLRLVQPSPQSLLNRPPQPSSLVWKITQACSRSKVDSRVAQRPGRGEERPVGVMGQTAGPGHPEGEGPSLYG